MFAQGRNRTLEGVLLRITSYMAFLILNPVKSLTLLFACVCLLAVAIQAQETVRAHSEVLGKNAPFSFPEKVVVGRNNDIYFLDTTLSSIFVQDLKSGNIKPLCGAEAIRSPSDISVDVKGQLWVLNNNGSRISKLNRQCAVSEEITLPNSSLRIGTNSFGEVIVLYETGPSLFALFSPRGKLLRSFGERIQYPEEVATSELSDGHIVPDKEGGFFFSFNYPPLIRHYGRTGRLIHEFKPESDVPIAPPNITVRSVGNAVSVNSKYQILVLDMTADGRGRLYLLISGKNKVPALNEGTRKLVVANSKGQVLKTLTLDHSFHRVVAGNGNLYLLRNKPPFRLDSYDQQE